MATKATREELGDLGVVYARLFEFVKNGKRPARAAIAGLQRLTDGQFTEDTRFHRYSHLLLSLDDQLARLNRYNWQYWDNRWTARQIVSVDTSGNLVQWVEDLRTFHVQFDTLAETVEMWQRVYFGELPSYSRSPGLLLDDDHLQRLARNTRRYAPGIHPIRINLAAHWQPKHCQTIDEVRSQAKVTSETLAQLEVLSAYGLHKELLREQDGSNLPHASMPGTVLTMPGYAAPFALGLRCWSGRRDASLVGVRLNDRHEGNKWEHHEWAHPVIMELSH